MTMRQQDTVSVIVPVFNGEQYLVEALASILGQTRPPEEIIVVDDGSTDGSVQLLADFPGIKVLRQANRGVAAARNLGLHHAAGDLFAFLDQDDTWHPDKLLLQATYLREHPDVAGTFVNQEMFLTEGMERPGWLRSGLLEHPHPSFVPGALLARRIAFERIGRFDESYLCGSDTDWVCRARDAGLRLEMLNDVLLYKRVHESNESQRVKVCLGDMTSLLRQSLQRKKALKT